MFGLLKKAAEAQGRVGLVFSADRLAVAVVRSNAERPVLERCESIAIDPSGGAEAVSTAVRTAGLPRLPVSVVLRPDDYQLALVEAPEVPPAELRAAMRWRLKEAIDFQVDDAVIDVFEVPPQNRGGQGRMVYAVAARRGAVERYAAALTALPSFDVVDVPELCLRNLAAVLPAAARGVALLHLGDTTATCVLVQGRTFYLSRQIALRPAASATGGDTASELLDAESIVLELQRSLDYYERHFDQPPITRIAISPAGARAEALATDLSRDTGFEVSALDLYSALNCTLPFTPAPQADCLLAIGAALREERRSL